jgi:hypothetical protein
MTATSTGAADTSELGGIETATDAFLASFKLPADAENQPSDEETRKKETPPSEQPEPKETETTSDESPEGGEEETEGEDKAKKKYVEEDDVYTKVKVNDQEHEVSVKDLKRLFGQEAALTRRSQEVAEQRKSVENKSLQYGAKLDRLVQSVTNRANEYRKVDFISLARDPNIHPDQLRTLQDEARKVFEEEAFLKGELNEVVQTAQKEQQDALLNRARECVKTLSDQASPYHIDGWGQKTYDDLRSFATNEGVDKEIVNGIVDAPVLKLLHMAMLYKQGASKVTTTVVNKTPKKIVKTSNTAAPPAAKATAKQKDAMKTLKSKGSVDAATDAFLARWENADND